MSRLCQAIIWIGDTGRLNTYCMRQAGHEGKCSPYPDKQEQPKPKEPKEPK